MTPPERRQAISNTLKAFASTPLREASLKLFEAMDYRSDKTLELKPNSPKTFLATFDGERKLNTEKALLGRWTTVDFLFQLTADEITAGGQSRLDFGGKGTWNGSVMESYLFFAIELQDDHYTRTDLADITRAVNRMFRQPAMLLFKRGPTLTLSVIDRRLHKRDESRDVLEKVTLIRDIRIADPHRAHIEILSDLALDALYDKHGFTNFVELHEAWRKTLDSSELNKRFFRDVANWYFWALNHIKFPRPADIKDADAYKAASLIRLITRLIFCWFVREKGLIPDDLFNPRKVQPLLDDANPKHSTYYKGIVQNLFFATLNQEMGQRAFRRENQNYMAHGLYRYKRLFKDPDAILRLFSGIPFLNGGLFECLDRVSGTKDDQTPIRMDGFSDRDDNPVMVPDFLFFSDEQEVDLSDTYGDTKFRRAKVRGLINTFDLYKFTVTENTPIEEEIALDPELLGKVFENLLAAYNPETGATARKQTGSFYTPREIVNYMVDESLIACLQTKLEAALPNAAKVEERLRQLFAYNEQPHQFSKEEVAVLIEAIDNLKVLDPACGSGAFPMGILHKLVFILKKLDPDNDLWKAKQIAKAFEIPDSTVREKVIDDIEETFTRNELDYGRKLYLIEKCIYGVDIQPIAVQIAKLRFFISLIVDQKIDPKAPNLGVRPLPNLETKFVAANTLIGIDRPKQTALRNPDIDAKEEELRQVRERYFSARDTKTKWRRREDDRRLRAEIAELLKRDGWKDEAARQLAAWDPYDQNASSGFFDLEWMFNLAGGVDIIIGNPPYGAILSAEHKDVLKNRFAALAERIRNTFLYFLGAGYELLDACGILCLILPNEFLFQIYMTKARRFVLDNAQYLFAINVGESAFDAIVPTCIVSAKKQRSTSYGIRILDLRGRDLPELGLWLDTSRFGVLPSEVLRAVPNSIFSFDVRSAEFVNRLASGHLRFECFCEDVANGISTSCDNVYIVPASKAAEDKFEKRYLKPCIRGGQFSKYYCPAETGDRLLYVTSEFNPKQGERILDYLSEHKEMLVRKCVEKKAGSRDWHILFRPRYEALFRCPKIIIRQTADRIIAALDEKVGFYCIDSVNVALVKDAPMPTLMFLLALLNSRLLSFFYREISQESGRVLAQVKPQRIRILPIAAANSSQQSAIAGLAANVMAARTADPNADTTACEREIDEHIYKLYGLTSEEIAIVGAEGDAPLVLPGTGNEGRHLSSDAASPAKNSTSSLRGSGQAINYDIKYRMGRDAGGKDG
jgi:hypothetical protein